MVKENLLYSKKSPEMRQRVIEGINIFDNNCTNKTIRNILMGILFLSAVKRNSILKEFEVEAVKIIIKPYLSFPLPTKMNMCISK